MIYLKITCDKEVVICKYTPKLLLIKKESTTMESTGTSTDEVSETYEKWYKTMIDKRFGNKISQLIACLVAYQAGEITISEGVKEMLMDLDIIDESSKIKIKDSKNMISWLEIAIRLQIHYNANNYRF